MRFVLTTALIASLLLNALLFMRLQQTSQQQPHHASLTQTNNSNQSKALSAESPKHTSPTLQSQESPADEPAETLEHKEKLQRAYDWLRDGQLNKVKNLFQEHLRLHPQDGDFLLLEADYIKLTEQPSYALNHYYSLFEYPLSDKQGRQLKGKIMELAKTHIDNLRLAEAWDILAYLVEPLWQVEPEEPLYVINLAEAYAQMQQASMAEYVLASLPQQDPQTMRIKRLIASTSVNTDEQANDNTEPNMQLYDRAISMVRSGEHYLVNGHLNGNRVKLMIDTGASTTVLTQQAYSQLRYGQRQKRFLGNYQINTAGGWVDAPVYQFAELNIAGFEVKDIAVVVLPMEDFSADGLLGMNYLKAFEFRLDQQNQKLYLR